LPVKQLEDAGLVDFLAGDDPDVIRFHHEALRGNVDTELLVFPDAGVGVVRLA
jgi:hypothetical protein